MAKTPLLPLPADYKENAKLRRKAYRHLLEKGDFNAMLRVLPNLHNDAFSKINCLSCANCCRNHSPRFKQPDIKRIAKRLKCKEGDVVARYLKIDEDGDYVTHTQPCPFLADDNTCNIYEDRPSDCRRYPYTDEDVFLKRVQLTLANTVVCPAAYTVMENLMQLQNKNPDPSKNPPKSL